MVVRNGYHRSQELLTSAGAVEVTVPRVNDKGANPATSGRKRFSAAISVQVQERRRPAPVWV